ncbi:MAG: hypothetical protein JRI83_01135 [Deltaproteobacteria bacterium]|nr:hypothetical protein [Deltaproteobacteria bacterium]
MHRTSLALDWVNRLNRSSERIPRRFCLTALLRGLERSGNPALRGYGIRERPERFP